MKKNLEELKDKCDDVKKIYEEATTKYQEAIDNTEKTEEEKNTLKTEYETALSNYRAKISEYNSKVDEYNKKAEDENKKINDLIPTYIENEWIESKDNKYSIDLTEFSGKKSFAIWAKLVKSDNTIVYDVQCFTFEGTKEEEAETITPKQTTNQESIKEETSAPNTSADKDTTISQTYLPNTGNNYIMIGIGVVLLGVIAVFSYKKSKSIKLK